LTWNEITENILQLVVGLGVVLAVAYAFITFMGKQIAERFNKKFEQTLDIEIEKFKNQLEKKNHISKTRFDAEFEIYRKLSKAFYEMVCNVNGFAPCGFVYKLADKALQQENEQMAFSIFSQSLKTAQDALYENQPLVPVIFFDSYKEILLLGRQQATAYEAQFDVLNPCSKETPEVYKRTQEMQDKYETLSGSIREYLFSLEC
jgi:hypothetical protein